LTHPPTLKSPQRAADRFVGDHLTTLGISVNDIIILKMAFGRSNAFSSAVKSQLDKDVDFPKGPEDTISALRWSPVAHHLAAASWDGKVYIYDATNSTTTDSIKGIAAINVGSPVLDCDFSKVSAT